MGCNAGRCLGPDDTGYPGSGTTQSISFKSSALVGCFLNSTKVDVGRIEIRKSRLQYPLIQVAGSNEISNKFSNVNLSKRRALGSVC